MIFLPCVYMMVVTGNGDWGVGAFMALGWEALIFIEIVKVFKK